MTESEPTVATAAATPEKAEKTTKVNIHLKGCEEETMACRNATVGCGKRCI